ncbi:hypothetical protein SIID45300_02149 [Candidatus Magnetaquicoccaceae bacterium FCR-1]|uniref:Uncharacterized protein n=1 Tax=Candidatus Magnetaquiglobus chichijimensis TaxID=3141448 RepID=A0ABQ0CAA3_9PROT
MNAVAAAFGNEDEPFDAETWLRNKTADLIGKRPAEWLSHGLFRTTGWDLAHRVGLSDLFWRSSDREVDGADAFAHLVSNSLGPVVGYVKQIYTAMDIAKRGNKERALEMLLPKAARDLLKSGRYIAEGGVLTMKGDRLLEDQLSAVELFGQALGFNPSRVAEQHAANTAIKNAERFIEDRRHRLLNAYGEAWRKGDDRAMDAVREQFFAFNQHHPRYSIKGDTIRHSLRTRQLMHNRAQHGITVNPKLSDLRDDAHYVVQ